MARVSVCLFSCKPAHRVKLCDRPKRLRQDLPARKVCPIWNGSPFPKKKKEKGLHSKSDRPSAQGPSDFERTPFSKSKNWKTGSIQNRTAQGPSDFERTPFSKSKTWKTGSIRYWAGPATAAFFDDVKIWTQHSTDLQRASVQQRVSKCRTTENCDKDKKDKKLSWT